MHYADKFSLSLASPHFFLIMPAMLWDWEETEVTAAVDRGVWLAAMGKRPHVQRRTGVATL